MTDPDRRLQIEAYESIYCYRTRPFVERQGFAATGDIAVRRRVFRAVGPRRNFEDGRHRLGDARDDAKAVGWSGSPGPK